jgi:hypothetical protein
VLQTQTFPVSVAKDLHESTVVVVVSTGAVEAAVVANVAASNDRIQEKSGVTGASAEDGAEA